MRDRSADSVRGSPRSRAAARGPDAARGAWRRTRRFPLMPSSVATSRAGRPWRANSSNAPKRLGFDLEPDLDQALPQHGLLPLVVPHLLQIAAVVDDAFEEAGPSCIRDLVLTGRAALAANHQGARDAEQPRPQAALVAVVAAVAIAVGKCQQRFLGDVLGVRVSEAETAGKAEEKRAVPVDVLRPDRLVVGLAQLFEQIRAGRGRTHRSTSL